MYSIYEYRKQSKYQECSGMMTFEITFATFFHIVYTIHQVIHHQSKSLHILHGIVCMFL